MPTTTTSAPAPRPASSANAQLFDLLHSSSSTTAQPAMPSMSNMSPPNAGMGGGMMSPPLQPAMSSRPSYNTAPSTTSVRSPSATVTSPKPSGSTFDDLWTSSITSAGGQAKTTAGAGMGNKTIKDLEKEKAMDKLWGPAAGAGSNAQKLQSPAKPSGGAFDDLLF